MTQKLPDEDWQEYLMYRAWWVLALRELLGWSESRTLRWAKKWEDYIKIDCGGDAGAFRNNAPAYYLAELLCPSRLMSKMKKLDPSERILLGSRFRRAIETDQGLKCYYDPNYDWKAATERLEQVLADYGERLRRIDEQEDDTGGSVTKQEND